MEDGTRTRDRQDHNLELYQLSYFHHSSAPPKSHRPKPSARPCGQMHEGTGYHGPGRASHVGVRLQVAVADVLDQPAVLDLEDAVGLLRDAAVVSDDQEGRPQRGIEVAEEL